MASINGKRVVFTGELESMTRAEAQAKAKALGATVASTVNAETDLLVAGPGAGSKLAAALKHGVKVLNEKQWIKMTGGGSKAAPAKIAKASAKKAAKKTAAKKTAGKKTAGKKTAGKKTAKSAATKSPKKKVTQSAGKKAAAKSAAAATAADARSLWKLLSAHDLASINQGLELAALSIETIDLGSGASMRLIEIPPGTFLMGSPASEHGRDDDETQHDVTISKAFWLGQTPVTQGQYLALMGSNPSEFHDGDDWRDRPVEQVTWYDAVEFCNALTAAVNEADPSLNLTPCYEITEVERDDEGTIRSARVSWSPGTNGFRLPTEAEWEYACRAGTQTRFSFGDDEALLGKHAWFDENSDDTTHPVATRRSNGWGLFDMHGNVEEWCWDWWGDYPSGAVTDPQGPRTGRSRVLRGGGWGNLSAGCRAAYRYGSDPGVDGDSNAVGFRVARTP